MRALGLVLLCALAAAPADAKPKKKKAAAAKKVKAPPRPAPEPVAKTLEKKSTVLLDTNPATVAGQLEAALGEGFTVAATDPELSDEIDRDAVIKAAKKARAVAVVTARYANGVWVLRTYSGSDGGVLAEATYKAAKTGPKVVIPKPTLAKLYGGVLKAESAAGQAGAEETASGASSTREKEKTAPAKEPEEKAEPEKPKSKSKKEKEKEPEPEATAEAEKPAPAADDGEKPQALHVGVGMNIANRRWVYRDDLFGALSRYTQPLAPRIAIEAELFPGAFVSKGPLSWFGLTASIDFLVFVTAIAADGTRYPTGSLRFKANLAGRIPIADRLEIGITFGYALTTYSITGDVETRPNVPDVAYSALRPAASVGLRVFGPIWVKAGFAYQIVLGTGQLGSAQYFPRITGGGLDTYGGVVVRPLKFLEVRATFDYQRFWFSMNPEVGDPYIAGGALDDSKGFSIFAAFTL